MTKQKGLTEKYKEKVSSLHHQFLWHVKMGQAESLETLFFQTYLDINSIKSVHHIFFRREETIDTCKLKCLKNEGKWDWHREWNIERKRRRFWTKTNQMTKDTHIIHILTNERIGYIRHHQRALFRKATSSYKHTQQVAFSFFNISRQDLWAGCCFFVHSSSFLLIRLFLIYISFLFFVQNTAPLFNECHT